MDKKEGRRLVDLTWLNVTALAYFFGYPLAVGILSNLEPALVPLIVWGASAIWFLVLLVEDTR